MKKIMKCSVLAMVIILTIVSMTSTTCSACSERLTYKVPGTLGDRGSVDINVTGNYINVNWEPVKQWEGGWCNLYIRDQSGNDKLLVNGRNGVSPGKYFLHMDWSSLISADVTVTFECGSNPAPPHSSPSHDVPSRRPDNYNENNYIPRQESTRSIARAPLSSHWPSEDLIRAELRTFSYNNYNYTTMSEAKEMLRDLEAAKISYGPDYVSGVFSSGAEITIWPNTYNKRSCYGFRYGEPLPGRPYFGSNDTYFEICK
jgi:hypothetical protein